MRHMPDILSLNLDKIFFRYATEGTYKYERLTTDQSTYRISQHDKIHERDIFDSLLAAHDTEHNRSPTRENLIAKAGLLIIAGSDTTVSALAATIFYLLHDEACYVCLEKKVIEHFSSVEDIRGGDQLAQCQHLNACITEAMRLSPVFGGIPSP
jgi:cytochrome P450